MGISPPRASGSIKFDGRRAPRAVPSHKIARARARVRPAGSPALPVAHRRPAPARSPRAEPRRTAGVDPRARLRAVSLAWRSASATAARSSRAASSRCSPSAARSLTNPRMLVMDEPSEGLAPAVIESLIETFKLLEEEGLAILLIEQNLGVATALAERQLIMIGGRDRRRDDRSGARPATPISSAGTSASSRSRTSLAALVSDARALSIVAARRRRGSGRRLRRRRRGATRSRFRQLRGTATTRSSR